MKGYPVYKNERDAQAEQSIPIAVVGIACRYPGANNPKHLWENILSCRREFRRFLDLRLPLRDYHDPDPEVPDKVYASRAAYIDGFEFDWGNRRIPRKTYEGTDIAQWLALDVAEQALNDAGYTRESVPQNRTGVVLGNTLTGEQSRANHLRLRWPFVKKVITKSALHSGMDSNALGKFLESTEKVYKSVFPLVDEDTLQGGLSNTIAGRITNYFNLHGGGFVVDGACSSSLLAVYNAANQLANNSLDIALAGGVDVSLDTFELIGFAKTNALASGDMRVYDKAAEGFLPGEGCGFVVLKRLQDALDADDEIYCVLKGWGISSDGKGGITAPNSDGQALALKRAYDMAGYSPLEVDFIEGHGTGTPRGDRTELEGIVKAMSGFGTPTTRACGITSFKSIVGHTKAAAGIGAFIKAAIAVNRRVLPPTAGCRDPHPLFSSEASALYPIVRGSQRDKSEIVRAGVSAMGFGGINSHVTVESYGKPSKKLESELSEQALLASRQRSELFTLTASSPEEFKKGALDLAVQVEKISVGDMVDLAKSLSTDSHKDKPIRAAIIAALPGELSSSLKELATIISNPSMIKEKLWVSANNNSWLSWGLHPKGVGYVFPGQGSARLNSGRALVERYQWARDLVAMADEVTLERLGFSISTYLFRDIERASAEEVMLWTSEIAQTQIAQPAICLVSLLYLEFLNRLEVKPQCVGGHSLGELVAFYASGAYDSKALMEFASERGKAMHEASKRNPGAMMSLAAPIDVVGELLKCTDGYVAVANLNAPKQTVIAGELRAINEVKEHALTEGIVATVLPVSGAFHTSLMQDAVMMLKDNMPTLNENKRISTPLISSTHGEFVEDEVDLHKHFFSQITSQVNFIEVVKKMRLSTDSIVEVGPGEVLSNLAKQITDDDTFSVPVCSRSLDICEINFALASLFVKGHSLNLVELYRNRLTREFRPVARRKFIENPCERELDDVVLNQNLFGSNQGYTRNDRMELENILGIDGSVLKQYFSMRKDFIASVIKSDISSLNNAEFDGEKHRIRSAQEDEIDAETTGLSKGKEKGQIESEILSLISKVTGFPLESLSSSMKLLDDLNLDSIKAAQILVDISKQLGIEGKWEGAELTNSSISEIASYAESLEDGKNPRDTGGAEQRQKASNSVVNVERGLKKIISDMTGFPEESIGFEARLLDDLNLDSIKAGQLISRIAQDYEIREQVDVSQYLNASVNEIIKFVSNARGGEIADGADKHTDAGGWIRNFTLEGEPKGHEGEGVVNGSRIAPMLMLYCDDLSKRVSESICTEFEKYEMQVSLEPVGNSQTAKEVVGDSYLVIVLPYGGDDDQGEYDGLRPYVEKLQSAISIAAKSRARTVCFMQISNGKLGVELSGEDVTPWSAISYVKSFYLETPNKKVRVIDICPHADLGVVSENIISDLSSGERFVASGYDLKGKRIEQSVKVSYPLNYSSRNIEWDENDVVVVTGGGKGITAECALELGKTIGVKFALVGSSPVPAIDGSEDNEISKTLARFNRAGINANYYRCDLTDKPSVLRLIDKISSGLGGIKAVVHGSGLNIARLAKDVSADEAVTEISPKVLGVMHILEALNDRPPQLVVCLSSIIGVTGMHGNALYAFSNENLNAILKRFRDRHNGTQVCSIAYSVWRDVGMGERMGVVEKLERQGITAVPVGEGVKRFVGLFLNDPGADQIIVSGKLSGIDTWRSLREQGNVNKLRFVKNLICDEPGVEIISRVRLSLDDDLYLNDHNFRGSYLFPTVFALEAMSQVSCALNRRSPSDIVSIDDISLTAPIIVDPNKGEIIEVRAIAEEIEDESTQRVYVDVRTEQTDFEKSHFSAVVTFSSLKEDYDKLPIRALDISTPLKIDPQVDLYGTYLFQGPLFQRLNAVYKVTKREVVISCLYRTTARQSESGYGGGIVSDRLAGDPFFRDVLLQSVQLSLAPSVVLPVSIGRVLLLNTPSENGVYYVRSLLKKEDGRDSVWDVVVNDERGEITEILIDYRVRKVNMPSSEALVSIDDLLDLKYLPEHSLGDEEKIKKAISEVNVDIDECISQIAISNQPHLGQRDKDHRHRVEEHIIQSALKSNERSLHSSGIVELSWSAQGKPRFSNDELIDLSVSIAHDDDYCLCVIGSDKQGCDIEVVKYRSEEEWSGMLANSHMNIVYQLISRGYDLSTSATMLWSACETCIKAFGKPINAFEILRVNDRGIVMELNYEGLLMNIVVVQIHLSVGEKRVVSILVPYQQNRLSKDNLRLAGA